jgi:hypothetical protein
MSNVVFWIVTPCPAGGYHVVTSILGEYITSIFTSPRMWKQYGHLRSQGSSGSKGFDYGVDDHGLIPGRDKGFFL